MRRCLSHVLLLPLLALLLPGGCKRATSEIAAGEDAFAAEAREPTLSVQVGAFTEEARARALRDSLALDGWTPWLTQGTLVVGNRRVEGWRVHVLPTASPRLAEAAVAAFKASGRQAIVSREPLPEDARDVGVEVWPVINRGTHGMVSRTRWLLSPDQRAVLVMEDPVSVEAEPLPNGVFLASEVTGNVLQIDSLWDAAPSPDWRLLGVGRAFMLRARGATEISPQQWRALARQLPEDIARDIAPGERTPAWEGWAEAQLRAHAFPVSGMDVASGVGIAQVIPIDSLLGLDPSRRVALGRARALRFQGWRIRWLPGGDTIAVGAAPRFPRDNSSSPLWFLERPTAPGSFGEVSDTAGFAPVPWVEGPLLDGSRPIKLSRDTVIETRRARIESRGGWIRVSRRGVRAGDAPARIVGPGVPLAITAGGRFVVVLVPRAVTKQGEVNATLVVYRVSL